VCSLPAGGSRGAADALDARGGGVGGVYGRGARSGSRALEATFLPRVRELLHQVGVLHVDESPGRAAGGLEYVHVAATPFLTAMHTGGRSKDDIDAGAVLPGYAGTIVRDGYAGYAHLGAAPCLVRSALIS
jgi:transposase